MSFPSAGVAPVAEAQLAAWQDIARGWQLTRAGHHDRCDRCGQSVIRRADRHGTLYTYPPGAELALVVAHLRQAHLDLDPDTGPGLRDS